VREKSNNETNAIENYLLVDGWKLEKNHVQEEGKEIRGDNVINLTWQIFGHLWSVPETGFVIEHVFRVTS